MPRDTAAASSSRTATRAYGRTMRAILKSLRRRNRANASAYRSMLGAPVVAKIYPKPTILQLRGKRGRWFGYASETGVSVHQVSVRCKTANGTFKNKVIRSRDVRFLDAAAPYESETTDPADIIAKDDDPIFDDRSDTQGRLYYQCSSCDEETTLYGFDYCSRAHCFSCTHAT